MTQESTPFSDEMLTAYLDGELEAQDVLALEAALDSDDALAARLAALDIPVAMLREVMAPDVLGAPALPAALAGLPDQKRLDAPAAKPRFVTPLTLVASFLVGMVATTLITPVPEPASDPAPLGWTAAVASYQALYVTETLSGVTQVQADVDAVLARAADEFDVALAPATDIEGVSFKRAQMLGFRGKPLLQMAYLTPEGAPMALCVIKTDKPDRGKKTVEMFDLAGVSWVKDGVGYFLIGGQNAGQIDALSTSIIASL